MKVELSRTQNGKTVRRTIPTGYSWTTAFFGPGPSGWRGRYLHALLIAVPWWFTYGLAGPVVAFFINKIQIRDMLADGWQIEDAVQRAFVEQQAQAAATARAEAAMKERSRPGLLNNRRFMITFGLINLAIVVTTIHLGVISILLPVLGFGGALFSLVFAKWLAIRAHHIRLIDAQPSRSEAERNLYAAVMDLSRRAGLPVAPAVGVYESADMNAFATGFSRNDSLVAFSSTLLEAMPPDQVRAVAAHEIAHVANQDMLAMVLLQGVINSIVLIASVPIQIFRLVNLFSEERNGTIDVICWIIQLIMTLVLVFIGSLIMKAFSRGREYRADAFAATLTGKESMIGALQTLSNDITPIPVQQRAYAALKVAGRVSIAEIFSTHPLTKKRIQALETGDFADSGQSTGAK